MLLNFNFYVLDIEMNLVNLDGINEIDKAKCS